MVKVMGFEVFGVDVLMSDFDIVKKAFPKETDNFLKREGNKLKKATLEKSRRLVKKKKGNYEKGIKRGKVYKYKGNKCIRVYGGAKHAHLLEYGHRAIVNGKEIGFVKGRQVYEKAAKDYESKFEKNSQKFADKIIEELNR